MKKTTVQYIRIEADFAEQRIDNFLITRLKTVPKTRIYRLIRKGEVRVNKKRIDPSYRLQTDDEVRIPPIQLEERKRIVPSQSLTTLLSNRILFEDKNLLIIDKPAGIPVHGGSQVKIGVIEALRAIYPKIPHLELAHRLDSDTSGCLILVKKRGILKEIHDLLRQGRVTKKYLALTLGHWKQDEYKVDVPLLKNYLSNGERVVRVNKEGKQALTVFNTLKNYKEASLVEVHLHTGRTHQIRVHAQYLKHPLAGDEKYGDKNFNKSMRSQGLKRLFLHAKSLEFTIPSLNQLVRVQSPLDADLEAFLSNLKKA